MKTEGIDVALEMQVKEGRSLGIFVEEVIDQMDAEELVRMKGEGVGRKKGARSLELVEAATDDQKETQQSLDRLFEQLRKVREGGMDEVANEMEGELKGMKKSVEQTIERSVRAGDAAAVDPKTGLATGAGLVYKDARLLVKGEEGRRVMEDTVEVVMDMMLFHRGVEELGEGFDGRIKLMADGLIAVAEYLADKDEGIYVQMSEEEIKNNKSLNKFFPEGSEQRVQLDELKNIGVKFEPARLNPGGGDEFEMRIDLNLRSGNYPVNEKRSRLSAMVAVMDWVLGNTTFTKDRPVLLGENREKVYSEQEVLERREAYEYFRNEMNYCIPHVKDGVSERESSFIYNFKDELRGLFEDVEEMYFRQGKGLLSPMVELRFDYAQIGIVGGSMPVLADVVRYFDDRQPFGDQNSTEYGELTKSIKEQLVREMDETDLRDGAVRGERAKELVYRSVFEKYQRFLFGEVNGPWKSRKKMEVVTNAMEGRGKDIYVVGAARRSFTETLSNVDKRNMWVSVIKYWVGRYKTELAKPAEKRIPQLADENSSFGQYMKMLTEVLPGGREKWQEQLGI